MVKQTIRFRLAISAERFLVVYKGHAKTISTTALDGRRIEFPAEKVKQFLTHDGIFGLFEMEVSDKHRFLSIKRLVN